METQRGAALRARRAGAGSLLDPGVIWLVVSAAGFGSMAIFAKEAYAAGVELPTLLAGRFALAALCLWVMVWGGRARLRLSGRQVVGLALMGGLGYVGQSFAYFTALQTIPAATTALLLYTYPALVTLLAWVLLKERLTAPRLLAVAVAFAGCVLVLGAPLSAQALDPAGVGWGLAAAAIYSVYIIAGTRVTAGVPPLLASAMITTAAALVYGGGGALGGQLVAPPDPTGWVWVAAIAVFCTVVAIVAFFAGLARVGPARAAILSTCEPVITLTLAALMLGEPLTWSQLGGGALILAAILILQWGGRVARNQGSRVREPVHTDPQSPTPDARPLTPDP
jgi:drug/metabolite transporter (DMT)-like permease